MLELRPALVLAAHPEHNTVDVRFLDTGGFFQGAMVLSPFCGTNFGSAGLVEPTPGNTEDGPLLSGDRDILAVVSMSGNNAYVLGFMYPQVSQMLFPDKDRRIERHPSDVYTSVDKDGNVEVYHPSGTFIRIGESPAHEDLTGKDYDKKWKIEKNTDKLPHINMVIANGGQTKGTISIDPDGNVATTGKGTLKATFDGDATIDTQATATVKAATKVVIDTPTCEMTGDLSVTGDVSDSKGSMQEMRETYNQHGTGAPNHPPGDMQ